MKLDIKKLSISILLPLLAGFIGSAFTFTGINSWYSQLEKPFFNPPNWIFGPVWTTLYILMGVALYLVWQKGLKDKKVSWAVYFFWIHLFFNTLWSILFFGLKNPYGALFCIVLLWFMIMILIIRFYKINKLASYLLMPYLAWVSFASILNFYIWLLN